MFSQRKWYVLIVACFFSLLVTTHSFSQVNTEAMRNKELTDGFSLSGSVNANAASGNTEFTIIESGLRLDYKHPGYHTFLISDYAYGIQGEEEFVKEGFTHLRVGKDLSEILTLEGYTQIEVDHFLNLKQRFLAGSGLRIKLPCKKKKLSFYLGLGAMYESEDYENVADEDKELIRASSYFTGSWKINESSKYYITAYLQPDVANLEDYRILLNSGLKFKLSETFFFQTKAEYRRDSEPTSGLKKDDLRILGGIGFDLTL